MQKQFVPYELSVKLKELGFDEPCFCIWNREKSLRFNNLKNPNDRNKSGKLTNNNGESPAPLWQQAFDWFMEKYNLSYCVAFNGSESYYWWITECKEFGIDINSIDESDFETYEEARQSCLKKLIELCNH